MYVYTYIYIYIYTCIYVYVILYISYLGPSRCRWRQPDASVLEQVVDFARRAQHVHLDHLAQRRQRGRLGPSLPVNGTV